MASQSEASPPFRRPVTATLLRTLVGAVVGGVVAGAGFALLGVDAATIERYPVLEPWSDASAAVPVAAGVVAGFVLWVGSWLDHFMSRYSRGLAFVVVAAAALGGAVTFPGVQAAFGPAYLAVDLAALLVAYTVANGAVPHSFAAPRAFRPF